MSIGKDSVVVSMNHCHSDFVQAYLIKKPFSQECVERHCYSVLYLVLVYGLFATWPFTIRPRVPEAKWVFEDRLGISARKLEGGAVGLGSRCRDQAAGAAAIRTIPDRYSRAMSDALVVAQRIIRKENFLVALFNQRLWI
jgi:hypothetical protein